MSRRGCRGSRVLARASRTSRCRSRRRRCWSRCPGRSRRSRPGRRRAVGVVVAEAGQAGDERLDGLAVGGDAEDLPAVAVAAGGDVEVAVVVRDAVPRRRRGPWRSGLPPVGLDPQQPRRRPDLAVAVAGLDDVRPVLLVERDAGGERQPGGDDFDTIALRDEDVGGVGRSLRRELHLSAAAGGAHAVAAGQREQR